MSILGQTPSDVSGALFQHNNLDDVPDKAAARENLNVPSKEDVLYSGVPIGAILPYFGTVAPAGFLPCFGQTITATSFPDLVEHLNPGGSTATITDLRGEFLRGWDNGRGVDLGRGMGTSQGGALQKHNHFLPTGSAGTSTTYPTLPDNVWVSQHVNPTPTSTTEATTYPNPNYASRGTEVGNVGTFADETRPRNVAILYCIKAYHAIENISSGVNLPGLISEFSALSADATRNSYFLGNQSLTANGYQKLPGGLIIQWGTAVLTNTSTYDPSSSTMVSALVQVVFPVTFPNATLSAVATTTEMPSQAGSEAREHSLSTESKSASNMYVRASRISGANTGSEVLYINWIALGY